jgi:putative redox protein
MLTDMPHLKTAQVVWEQHGSAFTITGGSGFALHVDEHSGPDAASPMELVAMAAGACTAMDVIDILRKKKQDITNFEVNVTGVRQQEHPKKFTEMDLEYVVTGHQVDPKAVERAIELSLTKYCSVNKSLEGSVAIKNHYRLIEAEPIAA